MLQIDNGQLFRQKEFNIYPCTVQLNHHHQVELMLRSTTLVWGAGLDRCEWQTLSEIISHISLVIIPKHSQKLILTLCQFPPIILYLKPSCKSDTVSLGDQSLFTISIIWYSPPFCFICNKSKLCPLSITIQYITIPARIYTIK